MASNQEKTKTERLYALCQIRRSVCHKACDCDFKPYRMGRMLMPGPPRDPCRRTPRDYGTTPSSVLGKISEYSSRSALLLGGTSRDGIS